ARAYRCRCPLPGSAVRVAGFAPPGVDRFPVAGADAVTAGATRPASITAVTSRGAELPMTTESMTAGQLGRRSRLADTVIEMLHEMEPDRIQMREVSERSGVALGTLYRYFPAKQQLLAAAML